MKILDENNQELDPNKIDLSLGYLSQEKFLINHLPRQTHYKVNCFIFDDGSSYTPVSEDDPHVQVINMDKGQFAYVSDKEDTRKVKGAAIGLVVDQEEQDIIETIQRYHLYTDEEVIMHGLPQRVTQTEESLQETNNSIEDINLGMEDLILLLAEMLGGEEYEEEEPIEEEESIEENEEVEPIEEEPIEEELIEENEEVEPTEEELIEENEEIKDMVEELIEEKENEEEIMEEMEE